MSKVRCAHCDQYIEKGKALRRGIQNFCNEEHRRNYFDAQRKVYEADPEWAALRERVIAADGDRCRFCGVPSSACRIEVHHIYYRSEGGGNNYSNLISLCLACHARVHSNKHLYQPLLEDIAMKRMVSGNKVTLVKDLK